MARLLVCLALVAAAAAFPSTFVERRVFSSNADCTGTTATATATQYYGIDQCVANAGSTATSTKYALENGNVVAWSFTGNVCAGTATVASNNTLGVCSGTSKYVQSTAAASIYGLTTYSDAGCSTLSDGPQFSLSGCTSSSGQVSFQVGGKLEICSWSGAGCTGSSDCNSISKDTCADTSGNGQTGSAKYDWNSASAATPAVALTAALMAVAAFVTKF